MAEPPPADEPLTEQLRRIEEIVRRLEGDDADLDIALSLFAEGVQRIKGAQERLQEAQAAVERVVADASGALGTEPLDGE
ncbi:MAG TPA: exodeoxyribonuclease VII small subunit [Gemmatimonadales bacterium]|nr:exodeoxyribonuclease VII small subunit [Gemmatimonadales bacterium]